MTELETHALLALLRLGDDAYGVSVSDAIHATIGREVSLAAVYLALDRLERQGLARPWLSPPRPERGGRARRSYRLTAAGRQALRRERDAVTRLWQDVDLGTEGPR
jgi:DNA-binding PadR family transcriptional regulator